MIVRSKLVETIPIVIPLVDDAPQPPRPVHHGAMALPTVKSQPAKQTPIATPFVVVAAHSRNYIPQREAVYAPWTHSWA